MRNHRDAFPKAPAGFRSLNRSQEPCPLDRHRSARARTELLEPITETGLHGQTGEPQVLRQSKIDHPKRREPAMTSHQRADQLRTAPEPIALSAIPEFERIDLEKSEKQWLPSGMGTVQERIEPDRRREL